MKLAENDLGAEVLGTIVKDEKVLVLRGIAVTYSLRVPEEDRELAERVHGFHARYCPVARSIEGAIAIETRLEFA